MADQADLEGTKLLRREFNKRSLDTSMADLRVSHGVAYIRGTISATRGSEGGSLQSIVEQIARNLRTKPGIRDVSIECSYRG